MNLIHSRVRRPRRTSALMGAGPVAAAVAAALVLVPSASAAGAYADPAGDSGAAGDISAVAVTSDSQNGQIVFRITGSNLATSFLNPLFMTIDSDANPLTGDLSDHGTDYWFGIDDEGYGFQRWDGSNWVDTSYATVHINGGGREVMISVNRGELGATSDFNFFVSTVFRLGGTWDYAPNDGMFNYSLEANGPRIDSVDVQTRPSAGPKAGKKFVVTPSGLKLPPDGRVNPIALLPESYSCTAKLGARALAGSGTGSCTFAVPKKKSRGKKLKVVLTVTYQGATKSVPLTFKVA
jgi:hypothetical protein